MQFLAIYSYAETKQLSCKITISTISKVHDCVRSHDSSFLETVKENCEEEEKVSVILESFKVAPAATSVSFPRKSLYFWAQGMGQRASVLAENTEDLNLTPGLT